MAALPHRVIDRASFFPADIEDECYVFDPINHAALMVHKRRAEVQAALLGGAGDPVGVETYVWVNAEIDHEQFGSEVDPRAIVFLWI